MDRADVVVIGSGPGGLTAAVALARQGMSVLVLEQHYLPGGWSHSFSMEGYRFSPGVHYIGDMQEGGSMRHLLEGLGVAADVPMREMNPDGYDHIRVGEERFDLPRGAGNVIGRLIERFPHERQGILHYYQLLDRVLADLKQVDELLELEDVWRVPFRVPSLLRWGFRPLSSLLDKTISDPLLKAFLSAQCGNHGLPPSQIALPLHAGMHFHYMDGAYFPEGGGRSLPLAFLRELRRHGGELRVRARVKRIVVDDGRARGVELEDGEQIRADAVVSNADPYHTYTQLLPPGARGRFEWMARRMRYTFGTVSLFGALDFDLEAAGFDSGNNWWYRNADVDGFYRRAQEKLPRRELDGLFVSFPTLKDPDYRPKGHHTVEAFTFVPWEPFARWKDLPPGERDPAYEALKQRLGAMMLRGLDELHPGLSKSLVFRSFATPIANRFYVQAPRGAIYGTAKTPWQVGPLSFTTQSPVPNVVNCGSSVLTHSIVGAAMSGLLAASKLLEVDSTSLLSAPDGSLRVTPAEAPRGIAPQDRALNDIGEADAAQ